MSGILRLKNLYPLESWFFPDIAKHPEALKMQWFNDFSGGEALSLPDLNKRMVEKLLIEKLKWLEVKETINFVTKASPHLVMFRNKNRLKEVSGILRFKELSKPYDGSKKEFRLYMQERFVEEFFCNADYCALSSKGLSQDVIRLLEKRVEKELLEKIISIVKNTEPAKAFDYMAGLARTAELTQFLPVGKEYIYPFINQVVLAAYEMRINFITTILEQGLIANAVLGMEFIHQKYLKADREDTCSCLIAKNKNFMNRTNKKRYKTLTLLSDSLLITKITDLIIRKNLSLKTIKEGEYIQNAI